MSQPKEGVFILLKLRLVISLAMFFISWVIDGAAPGSASQFYARVFTHHDFHAEVGFDIADDFADGGLRQAQLSCSRTYGATFNDFLKYHEVLCFR